MGRQDSGGQGESLTDILWTSMKAGGVWNSISASPGAGLGAMVCPCFQLVHSVWG